MIYYELIEKIENAWSEDTCYPWSKKDLVKDNRSLWQCAVTALLLQDILWWGILFNKTYNHYRNLLLDWTELDLTKDQFDSEVILHCDEVKDRDELLFSKSAIKAKTKERYELLKKRVLSK